MTNKCPICFGLLEKEERSTYTRIMDGNSIYQCKENKLHRFWVHPFSYKILHLNSNAQIDNFTWYKSYEFDDNNNIINIYINEKTIGELQ